MQNEERKTLKQQLAEGKALRLKEYQEKFESKNSTYILDEKAVKFYDELRKKELDNEIETKKLVNNELRKYKQAKESKESSIKIEKPKKSFKLKKPNKKLTRSDSKPLNED